MHPSGYVDNLIHNVNELLKLNKDKDAARIAHTVGMKKRLEIISKAESIGIKVLNGKKPQLKTTKPDDTASKQDQK